MAQRVLEGVITKGIKVLLEGVPRSFVRKMHGNRMQGAGIPDLLFVHGGRAIWIEVKRPGGERSEIQEYVGSRLEGAGSEVLVMTSVEEMRLWLKSRGLESVRR